VKVQVNERSAHFSVRVQLRGTAAAAILKASMRVNAADTEWLTRWIKKIEGASKGMVTSVY